MMDLETDVFIRCLAASFCERGRGRLRAPSARWPWSPPDGTIEEVRILTLRNKEHYNDKHSVELRLFEFNRRCGPLGGRVMRSIELMGSSRRTILAFAVLLLGTGCCGMGTSFLFLASSNQLDVIAGGAGFIAGAVLATGGLIATAVVAQFPVSFDKRVLANEGHRVVSPLLDVPRWLGHFQANRWNRPEPRWEAPIALADDVVRPLVRSLEQFQLGDGGGPACLIAWNAESFRSSSDGTRKLVDLWFAEEREHARLLNAAVARFGGRCITSHWSFTAFCLTRKVFGVRFELTVLLLTEIVSTVYYRLLRRHGGDVALRAMCRLILRDETGHIAFHRDRLARQARAGHARYGRIWESRFRILGLAAATMLWVNHAPGLQALGASRAEFYREVWRELSRFVRLLRRD
jgi:hypothetical protein